MAILFILAGGKVAKKLKVHHDEPKASDKVVLIEDTIFSVFHHRHHRVICQLLPGYYITVFGMLYQ